MRVVWNNDGRVSAVKLIESNESGICECPNPVCRSHDKNLRVPCYAGEVIDCGFCSNDKEARGPCKHLGEYLNRTKECVACRGTVKIKLFECAIHKICSINKPVGWHCCHSCGDYEEK